MGAMEPAHGRVGGGGVDAPPQGVNPTASLIWWRRLGRRLRPRQQLGSCYVAVLFSRGELEHTPCVFLGGACAASALQKKGTKGPWFFGGRAALLGL
jgi:hypothetical protein